MSYILSATDFSEAGNNALRYACGLAQALQKPLHILHSVILPITFSDTPMPIVPIEESRDSAATHLGTLINALRADFLDLSITTKILFGEIVDCMEEYTEDNGIPDFVVLGNSGSGNTALWLGSNVIDALKRLDFPVVAIPQDYSFRPLRKICYCFDLKDISQRTIPVEQVTDLTRATGAQLHLLHIDSQDHTAEEETYKQAVEDLFPEHNAQLHLVVHANFEEAIRDFSVNEQMDWLVVAPHRYGFFESLFHKSHTNAMVRTSTIPVVALHDS